MIPLVNVNLFSGVENLVIEILKSGSLLNLERNFETKFRPNVK